MDSSVDVNAMPSLVNFRHIRLVIVLISHIYGRNHLKTTKIYIKNQLDSSVHVSGCNFMTGS